MITIQFKAKRGTGDYSQISYFVDGDVKFQNKTSWNVRIADWNNDLPDKPEYAHIKDRMREIKDFVAIEVNSKYFNLPSAQIKMLIENKIAELPAGSESLSDVLIKYSKRISSMGAHNNTVTKYKRVAKAVKNFQDPILSLTDKKSFRYFMDGFLTYLLEQKHANNAIRQYLVAINTALKFYELDIITPISNIFNHRTFNQSDGDAPHFTTEEVMLLYNHKCKIAHKQVLDMLVFCAFTGLRHGELLYVTADRIKNMGTYWALERYSPKEKNSNVIPLNDICMEIINKYKHIDLTCKRNWKIHHPALPVSNNMFCNKVLHIVMEEIAGPFFENFRSVIHHGTQMVETNLPRWKALSFHSARHHYSFWLRNKGVSITDISYLLNHKSIATTLRTYKHEDASIIAEKTYNLIKN